MSFRLKTILGIALIETVFLLVLVFSGLYFLRGSNETQLVDHARTTSQLFASMTKDGVLATDLASLESFVQDLLSNPQISYVRIRNADKLILAEGGATHLLAQSRLPDQTLDSVNDDVFDVVAPINEGGINYGQVELGMSTLPITGVYNSFKQFAFSVAFTEVLLVAFVSFVLGTYLTRRLQHLQSGAKAISTHGPGQQIAVNGSDEIAEVTIAFNTMSRALEKNYQQLNASLTTSNQRLDQAERNRLKNEAILASSLDAIVSIDQYGSVVDYNHVAEQTFGWTRDEILGQSMAEFLIPEELRSAHNAGMDHYLASGEGPVLNQRVQLTALHKNGTVIPVELAIADIQTPDGPLFTAFLRDISKDLRNQTELRLAATAFETIEPMFFTDEKARIIRVNDAFLKTSGYSAEEVIGQNPKMWSSGRQPPEFYRSLWQSLNDKGEWSGEIYNRRKNGEIFPEYLSISAVRDDEGSVTNYVAHLIDISEQKERENQLHLASQQAQKADRAKSRFLAVMTHEMRTPLNAVLGMLDLLKETELNEHQQRLITTGENSSELLLSVINDILDFSSMEAGKLKLDHQTFNLHAVIEQSIEFLSCQAKQKGLGLITVLDPGLPQSVKGDKMRLRQVLVNLVSNAVKFTDTGNITVSASAELSENQEVVLNCQVQDTGIGIPPSLQATLFQEFSKIDQSDARNSNGTGLGLAISKRLVNLMGGDITLESQLNQGSCFSFNIRLASAQGEEIPVAEQPLSHPKFAHTPRLLLAEDNVANQSIFKAMLANEALHLDVVADGYAAVQAASTQQYDVILMDVSMPRMDGISATQTIRKLEDGKGQVPIIAITAHGMPSDRERFLEAGMNDYLSKPVRKVDLLQKISHWVPQNTTQSDDNANSVKPPLEQLDGASDVVDHKVLRQLVTDTSAEIVPTLLKGYIADAHNRLQKINAAVIEKDLKTLEFETHTLGSSAGAHGNPELLSAAREVESLCRNKQDSALDAVDKLLVIAEASLAALEPFTEDGIFNLDE